ncbi:hypothetical protein HHI36_009010 [Cryptolaemus montrouzieri]|uniref:Uncharacterized protein n=1 Tax=Cryptolaemus montrouzieri TaxID=559131 RepID=A0ABD2MU15_9CUCU
MLWKRYFRSQRVADYSTFRRASNSLSKQVSIARDPYDRGLGTGDKKKFLKYVRRPFNSTVRIPHLEKPNGEICHSNVDNANTETFGSVFSRLPTTLSFPSLLSPRIQSSIHDLPIEKMLSLQQFPKKEKN